jgi:competence ComEA-like helix-hairpin-helix protein
MTATTALRPNIQPRRAGSKAQKNTKKRKCDFEANNYQEINNITLKPEAIEPPSPTHRTHVFSPSNATQTPTQTPAKSRHTHTLTPPTMSDSMKSINPAKQNRIPRAILLAIALPAILAPSLLADDPLLPEGKGRESVENACTVCHTPDRIMKQSLTADQWRSEVRTMIENGASLNDNEWEPVIAYLTRNFGPKIDINKSTAHEIADALQLTAAEAEAIVAYRKTNGDFKQLDDMKKIPAFDANRIAGEEKRITF